MIYTVIGMYEDNGQLYTTTVEANDGWEAFGKVAAQNTTDSFVLVGVIKGVHEVLAPCDETGRTCYAIDYADGEETATEADLL